MAADSLLPLFHERAAGNSMVDTSTEQDDVLAELLGGAGVRHISSELKLSMLLIFLQDDLLATLLEPGSTYLNDMSSPPLLTTYADLPANDTFNQDVYPADDVRTNTPQSYSSSSPVDILGNSPNSASPGDVMMTSSNVMSTDYLGVLLGSITSVSSGESSTDVRINVGEFLVREGRMSFICVS